MKFQRIFSVRFAFLWVVVSGSVIFALGCSTPSTSSSLGKEPSTSVEKIKEDPEITAERANLSPEDRALVESQEWCVVSNDERLGSMGKPIKLMIKDQVVFVCCGGCKRKAEANPDKTLAKLEELKAKAKALKP